MYSCSGIQLLLPFNVVVVVLVSVVADTHRQWSYLVVYDSWRRLVTLVLVIFILILQSTFSRLHRHLYVFFFLFSWLRIIFLSIITVLLLYVYCCLTIQQFYYLIPISFIFFFRNVEFPSFCVHDFAFYCQFPLLCVAALLPIDCLCSVLQ